MWTLLCLVLTAGAVTADIMAPTIYDTSDLALLRLFDSFKDDYSRNYSSMEETIKRYDIFVDNVYKINEHNEKYPNIKFTLDITKFTDWTQEEFSMLNNLRIDDNIYKQEYYVDQVSSLSTLPSSIDWTTVTPSVITPVKDQGNCGSCWAFGATGSWESHYAIKYGVLNSLSQQELVDCVPDNNCNGGAAEDAYLYGIKAGGDSLETDYPYTGHDGKCQASEHKHYDVLKSVTVIRPYNETAMMEGLVVGPVTVSLNADGHGWSSYKSGIYDAECEYGPYELDHTVLLVGYGQDSNNDKYWKIKNSWGTSWGMEGYMFICRDCGKGREGECGINTYPNYPNIAQNNTITTQNN